MNRLDDFLKQKMDGEPESAPSSWDALEKALPPSSAGGMAPDIVEHGLEGRGSKRALVSDAPLELPPLELPGRALAPRLAEDGSEKPCHPPGHPDRGA